MVSFNHFKLPLCPLPRGGTMYSCTLSVGRFLHLSFIPHPLIPTLFLFLHLGYELLVALLVIYIHSSTLRFRLYFAVEYLIISNFNRGERRPRACSLFLHLFYLACYWKGKIPLDYE